MAPREIENNAYTKFGGDKKRALWYGMVFSERDCSFTSIFSLVPRRFRPVHSWTLP